MKASSFPSYHRVPGSFFLSHGSSKVGGQAIIEGVMMRSKQFVSMAVRRKNNEIVCERFPYVSVSQKYKILGWPVIRGFVQLAESLYLGLKALNYSADIAIQDENGAAEIKPKTWKDSLTSGATMVFSFALAMGIFMYLPLFLTNLIGRDQNPFAFNAVAGAIRIIFFLGYLWIISLWKDIRRVFEYHGAEHKSIFMYEDGMELTVENAQKYKTHHPRCGTSFLLIVALLCILVFAIIDGAVAAIWGPYPTVAHRFLAHFFMIPLVSGLSYEVLKASDKGRNNAVVRFFLQPGLWLQRITTQEPDAAQLEVAFRALKEVV